MLIYMAILVAKLVEVALMTIRMVLVTKGEKTIASIIGFFEVLLWIYIASTVLQGISDDPLKAVFYALGFALGNYFGSILEEKLGIGLSELQVIVREEDGEELTKHLREEGFAVTVVEGKGKNSKRHILFLFLKRKRVHYVVDLIKEKQSNAVMTISERKPIYGGYGMTRK